MMIDTSMVHYGHSLKRTNDIDNHFDEKVGFK